MKSQKVSCHDRRVKGAFTLIELLVVIAIIAILAGILMPALSQSRERAKATRCTSHMKEIGLAMSFYLEDNKDEMYIYHGDSQTRWCTLINLKTNEGVRSESSIKNWKYGRNNYISNLDMLLCPAAAPFTYQVKEYENKVPTAAGPQKAMNISFYGAVTSYKRWPKSPRDDNRNVFAGAKANATEYKENEAVLRTKLLKSPGTCLVLADNYHAGWKTQHYYLDLGSGNSTNVVNGIHQDRANILWADGHVNLNTITDIRVTLPWVTWNQGGHFFMSSVQEVIAY